MTDDTNYVVGLDVLSFRDILDRIDSRGGAWERSPSMTIQGNFDLVLAGHITKDRIIIDGKETVATGGAVYYGAFPASLFDVDVAVVTKLAHRDLHILDELREAGITVIHRESRATTVIQNIPKSADFERRRFVVDEVADPFTPADFDGIEARILTLCPLMKGEISLDILKSLSKRFELALDVQGFIRVRDGSALRSSDWPDKEEALSCITYLKTDKRETEILTGLDDVEQAALRLAALGPREVIVTDMEGVLLCVDGECRSVPFNVEKVVGRTGRGDTAFATYLANRIRRGCEESLGRAAALVSKKLGQNGAFKGPLSSIEP